MTSLLFAVWLTASCTSAQGDAATTSTTATTATAAETLPHQTVPAESLPTRPAWLGSRPLPTDAKGFGVATGTPPELVDRRFATIDTLPPPPDGVFESRIDALEGEPLGRSTWREGCPVDPSELRYLTVSFRGFDGLAHTGELIVAASVADDIVEVFHHAWEAGFPFEEMRVVTPADLDAAPTGDGNNTGSYVCRPVTGGTRFSEHAYGLAIDVNAFHNPYVRNDLVLPELALSYIDRSELRPGMLGPGDPVVSAFADIGWQWGGNWSSLKDWQHFSRNGR